MMCSDAMLHDRDHETRDDEIVAEVRAARDRLAAAVGHDLDRHWAQLKVLEAEERARGRTVLTPPAGATDKSGAAA
jgi:hypothetical protein